MTTATLSSLGMADGATGLHLLAKCLHLNRDGWAWDEGRSLAPRSPEPVELNQKELLCFPSSTQQPKALPLLKPFLPS